jgi:hypothetical protein
LGKTKEELEVKASRKVSALEALVRGVVVVDVVDADDVVDVDVVDVVDVVAVVVDDVVVVVEGVVVDMPKSSWK